MFIQLSNITTQLKLVGKLCFAEVQFFFRLVVGSEVRTLALVSVYSDPHPGLLEASTHTLWSCIYQGDAALRIVDVKAITGVIAMIPHRPFPDGPDRFFVLEKPGQDVARMAGNEEEMTDE
jgi:hypothetical protein